MAGIFNCPIFRFQPRRALMSPSMTNLVAPNRITIPEKQTNVHQDADESKAPTELENLQHYRVVVLGMNRTNQEGFRVFARSR